MLGLGFEFCIVRPRPYKTILLQVQSPSSVAVAAAKKTFQALLSLPQKVTIPCNVTERTIEFTLTAEKSKDLEEHIKCFAKYRCH